jgi:hypothetical protein
MSEDPESKRTGAGRLLDELILLLPLMLRPVRAMMNS